MWSADPCLCSNNNESGAWRVVCTWEEQLRPTRVEADDLVEARPYLNENHVAYLDAFATDRTIPHSLRAVRA